MPAAILADISVTVSELKKAPTAALESGKGRPVAIMNHNKPTFYAVPAELFEKWMEILDDAALVQLDRERADEVPVPVSLNDL